MCGWVKLYKDIEQWEWYKDSQTKSLFLHLILKANWKDGSYMGQVVKRGQFVTGRKALSSETGIAETTIERHLQRLVKSGEIEQQTDNKKRLITICNYDDYQTEENTKNPKVDNKRTTNGQQTDTIEEVKKERSKEVKKETNKAAVPFVRPDFKDVESFFLGKGYPQEASKFFDYYESNGWRVGKNKMQKWASAASCWITRSRTTRKPQNTNEGRREQNSDAREQFAEEILAKKYGITRTGDGSNQGVVGKIQR